MAATNICWTYYSHPIWQGDRPLKEAIPVYESVDEAVVALKNIIKVNDERLANAQSHRRYSIGQALGEGKLPRWGKTALFYRGHSSIRHYLLPTMFRNISDDKAQALEEIATRSQRLNTCIERLDALGQRVNELAFLRGLSIRQKEAILRHYGCPSSLLDVTTSIDVAAHFASNWTRPKDGSHGQDEESVELGIIYAFNLIDILNTSGVSNSGDWEGHVGYEYTPIGNTSRELLCYESPFVAWREDIAIGFRNVNTISFDFTFIPDVARIEKQNAAFLSAHNKYSPQTNENTSSLGCLGVWDVLAFFAYKVCFIQTGGVYSKGLQIDDGESIYPDDILTKWVTGILQEC